MPGKYDYDVIIIGAGISGLVCGCYLAKAGMKTLIVEKNKKPGGYCTSFRRGGFNFDACVHSFGSLREGGNIRVVLQELGVEDRLKIRRYNPSDIIVTPDSALHVWNKIDDTIQEFQNRFPKESDNIIKFFKFIESCQGISFSPLRSLTFQSLLDEYFEDMKLKSVLSLPLLGSAGLPATKISALTGVLVYKEFILDGGYYPADSIQSFPDLLACRFEESGGDIRYSCCVTRIRVDNNRVKGVELDTGENVSAEHIVSSADATLTFLSLLGPERTGEETVRLLEHTEPSLSAFIVYLGLDGGLNDIRSDSVIWLLPHYNVDQIYGLTLEGDIDRLDWFLIKPSADRKRILMMVSVPFKDDEYWKTHKLRLTDLFIRKMEQVVPGLSSRVVYKDAATPRTLRKWTLNHKGAAFGWARTPLQFAVKGLSQAGVQNLYMTGHWTTLAQGVSGVAFLGRRTASAILSNRGSSVPYV